MRPRLLWRLLDYVRREWGFQLVSTGIILVLLAGISLGGNVASVAAICCAITAILVSLYWAWERGPRSRILALLITYISLVAAFGAAHYSLFLSRPSHYSFSSTIEEGRALSAFSEDFGYLRRLNEELLYLGLLEPNAMVLLQAKEVELAYTGPRADLIESEEGFVEFYPGLRFRFRTEVIPLATGASIAYYVDLRGEDFASERGGDNIFLPDVRAVISMHEADTQAELRKATKRLIAALEQARSIRIRRLWAEVGRRPEWEFFDFCYFSVVTMTTVGYGDITPNSAPARMAVLIQSITGVFYVAFALAYLWPGVQVDNSKLEASIRATANAADRADA